LRKTEKNNVKNTFLLIGVLTLSLVLFSQELSHDTLVVNIEVSVRVYKGGKFIDHLAIDDFEVYEDGKLQKTEAVYLIKKKNIERKEGKKKFAPQTSRSFYLLFEVTEFTPRMGEALNYFIQDVLVSGDNLQIVTPVKTYRLKSERLKILPKELIANQLKEILRRDAITGSSEYRNAVDDVARLAQELSPAQGRSELSTNEYTGMALDEMLSRYRNLVERLEQTRSIDQKKLLEFAEILKNKEGQKYVFLFYQREYIPQISRKVLNQMMSANQGRPDILITLTELFDFYRRETPFDVDRAKQAYADSSVSIHFLFFTKPARHIPGVRMEEHSEDIFNAFKEIAEASGGFTESSSNPIFLLQKAVDASENYYLLYYSPANYQRDGKFKKITVKIKNGNYRISHRTGYFAN
jgi:VWFA-related protein